MELFNTCREFTARTNVWQESLAVPISPNVYEYGLVANTSAIINRLMWTEGNRPTTPAGSTSPEVPGTPRIGFLRRPGISTTTLIIQTPPGAAETWHAHVALVIVDPTNASGVPEMPEWIIDKYFMVLMDGLLSKMMSQPSKPYANKEAAIFHGKKFLAGMNAAKTEVARGNLYGGQSWNFPQMFRTRTQRFGA